MSARNVVVLCPNGRRQQIKVTNNSTNLQILEDVCRKQDLKSEEFDLKHYNKILDPSSTVQFSNLPNNAQLELVGITKPRKEEDVRIALQLEDGQRFIHTFASSSTLWDVLAWFRSNENWEDTDQIPVCVYMRREISGAALLSETCLRSLGLASGSGVIRLIYKPVVDAGASFIPNPTVESAESSRQEPNANAKEKENENENEKEKEKESDVVARPGCSKETSVEMELDDRNGPGLLSLSSADVELQLDKRKAFIFSLDDIEHVPSFDELPEGFFDLTVDDVRVLMTDLKRQRLQLENRALLTSEMRDAQLKRKMAKYPETVIRVFFPDRLVLQGNFKATETVADVMSFVRHFLRDHSMNFYLFTAPPKRHLVPQVQLVAASLVPGANVYFGSGANLDVLRPEVYSRLASPLVANREAILPRTEHVDADQAMLDLTNEHGQMCFQQPTSSCDAVPAQPHIERNSVAPKWLKLGKK